MAVNNFAPAEYGGYVLGANSGGGGGGSSPFDEFMGYSNFANVTLNLTLPEGVTGIKNTSIWVQVLNGETFEGTSFGIENRTSNVDELIIPIVEDTESKISLLDGFSFVGNDDSQLSVDSATAEGSVSVGEYDITISGDGTINLVLNVSY